MSTDRLPCSHRVANAPAYGDYACDRPAVAVVVAKGPADDSPAGAMLCESHRQLAEARGARTSPLPLHPAACPHCGGKVVNQIQPDYHLRPAQLNDNGTIIVGDVVDGADFPGPNLLYCHTCGSTYVQPGDVEQVDISALKLTYPEAVKPGDPEFLGMGVAWTPVPTASTWSAPHRVTARG